MHIKDIGLLCRLFGKRTIHVEASHLNSVWDKLRRYTISRKCLCYVITPANYQYIKSNFGCDTSKRKLCKILKKRYLVLKNNNCEIQLHVHLSQFPSSMHNKEKEKLIKEAYNWLAKNVEKPTKIVFGWFAWDKFSEKLTKSLGLKIIGRHFHIYDYWLE